MVVCTHAHKLHFLSFNDIYIMIKWNLCGILSVFIIGIFLLLVYYWMRGSVSKGSVLVGFKPGGISRITNFTYFKDPIKCVGEGFLEKGHFEKWLSENSGNFIVRNTSEEHPEMFQRYVSFSPSSNDSVIFFRSTDGVHCSNLDKSGGGTALLFDNQTSKIYFFISKY